MNNRLKLKYTYIILLALIMGCKSQDKSMESEMPTEVVSEEATLTVQQILSNNPAVKVGPLLKRSVKETIKCTGRIDLPPMELISIHSKTEGFINYLQFIEGDYVRKGALLFIISNPELIEKQRRLLETKAELSIAEKEVKRKKALIAEEATTQKSYEQAVGQMDLLTATYMGLKKELEIIGIDIVSLEKEMNYQSQIRIYAPDNGSIHHINVNKGQRIDPSKELMSIANDDHMHLELDILPKDAGYIAHGQVVQFTLPNSNKIYYAEVEKINPMIDEITGTLRVHCHIRKDTGNMIKTGLFTNAEVAVGTREVFGLPMDAVIKEGEDYFIYVKQGDQFQKQMLTNPDIVNGFVAIDSMDVEVVTAGAYYIE